MFAQPVRARSGPTGEQTVDVIVDHGDRPDFIVARAGAPLRVVFHRRDAAEWAATTARCRLDIPATGRSTV